MSKSKLFTQQDLEQAVSDGIFDETGNVTGSQSEIIQWFKEWARFKSNTHQPGNKISVGAKVRHVTNERRTGEVIQEEQCEHADRWLVKWDLTGVVRTEDSFSLIKLEQ